MVTEKRKATQRVASANYRAKTKETLERIMVLLEEILKKLDK